MRARALLNLALLAVVAALAYFAIRADAPPPQDENVERLSTIEPNSIRRIGVELRGGEGYVLNRTDPGWDVEWRRRLAANEFKVQTLTAMLRAPVRAGFRAEGNDLAQFGLEPPRAVVTFDGTRFELGDTDPLDRRRYVRNGDEIVLLNDTVMHHLTSGPEGFVHPNPLGPAPRPRRLALPALTLERKDGRWKLEPPSAATSADTVIAFVDRWRHARAARVTTSTSSPTTEVAVELEDGRQIVLGVVRTSVHIVLVRGDLGLDYHFVKSAGERLLAPGP